MAVFIDVKSRFDDASGKKAAEEAKAYFANAGTTAGSQFNSNFAQAIERDDKVRAAADKVADRLDKVTAAEAKRATQLEKSKAINEAVAASEAKLAKQRELGFDASAAQTEKELATLREKQVEIDNKLVVSSTAVSRAQRDKARAVREAGDAYRDMGNDVDSLGSKLAKLGDAGGALKLNLGLAALGTLPAAATAITEVAGALQQLAGAGFAVPGIFAGIASSVGVGVLGMHGMSDAIKAVDKASDGTKASVEAANKALADLPAGSADVVKTVVGLKGTFTDLQKIDSNNLFAGVSDGIKQLAAADLPVVTKGVNEISNALNGNLRQAMTSLGSGSTQGFLSQIFGNTAQAQANLTKAIDPVVYAIGTLSAAGSSSLPRLANAIGDVANRFDAFITGADSDGRLQKWIDNGLTGFRQLGDTALNIGHSFTAITEAAGGGAGLLGTLESATGKLDTFLNSTAGQNKLAAFFAEGRDMLGQLKDIATTAGPTLAGVFTAGIGAANLYLPVIKTILDTINAIPGGASAVVGAFTTWKTITGVADLAKSLTGIMDLLKIGVPAAAAEGAAAASSSIAGIGAAASAVLGPLAAVSAALLLLKSNYDAATRGDAQKPGQTTPTDPQGKLGLQDRNNTGTIVNGVPATAGDPIFDPKYGQDPFAGGATGAHGRGSGVGLAPLPAQAPTAWGFAPPPGSPAAAALAPTPTGLGSNSNLILTPGTTVPGISSYTPPAITAGGGGGGGGAGGKTPNIDESHFMAGDPLAGLPAAVPGADPQAVFDADSKLISASNSLEQKKLALQVLEAKGNATQQELLTAKNDLQEQERALYTAQNEDIKARTGQMKQATSDLKSIFAPLDQDFGFSKGIPGVVENLTKLFGNMALAGAVGSSPSLQSAAMSLVGGGSSGGGGMFGMFGAGGGAGGFANPNVNAMIAAAQAGSGGKYAAASDLVNGLSDCSGAVSDLYEILRDGVSSPARDFTTANFATPAGAAKLGFSPGYMPGAFNIGVHQGGPGGGHMAATLPNGVNFESGGGTGQGATYGGPAAGALNPEFESHYYIPVGPSMGPVGPSAIGPAPLGGGLGAPTPMGWGAGGLGGTPAGAGGQGFGAGLTPGMAGQGAGAPVGFSTGVQPSANPGGGIGITPGGTLDSALSTAASIVPGGGAAAQVGIKLASRAIQFGGQAAGILAGGALDTILPAGSPLAANSWFSKLLGGIAGARPATPNQAGQPNPQNAPQMNGGAGGQGGGGTDNSVTNHIAVTNNQASEDQNGKVIGDHLMASYSGPGR